MELLLFIVPVITLGAAALGCAGIYVAVALWRCIRDTEKRLESLEKSALKRHTHATIAGLEDALAIAIDALREYEDSRRYTEARIKQLQDVLKILRSGPNSYDENRPGGERPKRRFEEK